MPQLTALREFPGFNTEGSLIVPGGLHELTKGSRESGEGKAAMIHRTEYRRKKSAKKENFSSLKMVLL